MSDEPQVNYCIEGTHDRIREEERAAARERIETALDLGGSESLLRRVRAVLDQDATDDGLGYQEAGRIVALWVRDHAKAHVLEAFGLDMGVERVPHRTFERISGDLFRCLDCGAEGRITPDPPHWKAEPAAGLPTADELAQALTECAPARPGVC